MGKPQYEANNRELGLHFLIRPSSSKELKEIGGSGTVLGEATIQVPLLILGIVLDVDFSSLRKDSSSLLSKWDMLTNGLDISLL